MSARMYRADVFCEHDPGTSIRPRLRCAPFEGSGLTPFATHGGAVFFVPTADPPRWRSPHPMKKLNPQPAQLTAALKQAMAAGLLNKRPAPTSPAQTTTRSSERRNKHKTFPESPRPTASSTFHPASSSATSTATSRPGSASGSTAEPPSNSRPSPQPAKATPTPSRTKPTTSNVGQGVRLADALPEQGRPRRYRGTIDPDLLPQFLEEEARYSNLKVFKTASAVIKECRVRVPDDRTPLLDMDCSNLDTVLRNANLPEDRHRAGRAFLKQLKDRSWLQSVDDHELACRMALILAFGGKLGVKTPLCTNGKWLCHDTVECPLCRHRYKATLLVRDYAQVYDKANCHYGVTLTFTASPKRAGVWFVTNRTEVDGRWTEEYERYNPFEKSPKGAGLKVDEGELDGKQGTVPRCFRACFSGMKAMVGAKLFAGAVVTHEVAWRFMKRGKFDPRVTPHTHAYTNRGEELTFEKAIAGYDAFVQASCMQWMSKPKFKRHQTAADAYRSLAVSGQVYPALHVVRLPEAKAVRRWIYYSVKTHKFVTEYRRAIKAGASLHDLNEFMRDQVFKRGREILATANSPCRYGNLKFRAVKADEYLGDRLRVSNRQAARREQKARREAGEALRPYRLGRSPLRIEMDRQAQGDFGVEMPDETHRFRSRSDARTMRRSGEHENASTGNTPSSSSETTTWRRFGKARADQESGACDPLARPRPPADSVKRSSRDGRARQWRGPSSHAMAAGCASAP